MNTRTYIDHIWLRQVAGLAAKFTERLVARAVMKHKSLNVLAA